MAMECKVKLVLFRKFNLSIIQIIIKPSEKYSFRRELCDFVVFSANYGDCRDDSDSVFGNILDQDDECPVTVQDSSENISLVPI